MPELKQVPGGGEPATPVGGADAVVLAVWVAAAQVAAYVLVGRRDT
ncbi:MAG TPA: hypothetical protein VGP36_19085 [Mycobacteriales bacterium]|nr:hypothetical protein [Mycobacteriales bacterium]